jgi:hypothetical protein
MFGDSKAKEFPIYRCAPWFPYQIALRIYNVIFYMVANLGKFLPIPSAKLCPFGGTLRNRDGTATQ